MYFPTLPVSESRRPSSHPTPTSTTTTCFVVHTDTHHGGGCTLQTCCSYSPEVRDLPNLLQPNIRAHWREIPPRTFTWPVHGSILPRGAYSRPLQPYGRWLQDTGLG